MSASITSLSDGSKIVWGFMFENTLFTEFERRNHPIIEAAYRQRKKKHSSHHITIVDSNLPKPGKAKVYFGVAQNHLRMPGTRYYVNRQVIKPTSSSPPFSVPMLMPSPTSTTSSSSSFSSLDMSFINCQQYNVPPPPPPQQEQQYMSPYQQQPQYISIDYCQPQSPFCQQLLNSNILDQALTEDFSFLQMDQNILDPFMNSDSDNAGDAPLLYYDGNVFIPEFNTWNVAGDSAWFDDNLLLEPSSFQVPWTSPVEAFDSNQLDLTNMYI